MEIEQNILMNNETPLNRPYLLLSLMKLLVSKGKFCSSK